MNILNKLTIKHLKMNKRRTIVTIIGVALSTMLMVAIGLFFSSIREYIINVTMKNLGSHHVVYKIKIDDINIFADDPNISEYKYYGEVGKSFINFSQSYLEKLKEYGHTDQEGLDYIIYGVSENYLDEYQIIQGRYPKNANEVMVDFGYSKYDYMDLAINKKIEDKNGNSYTVVGFYEIERLYNGPYDFITISDQYEENTYTETNASVYVTYKDINKLDKNVEYTANNLGYVNSVSSSKLVINSNINYNDALINLYGFSRGYTTMAILTFLIVLVLSIIAITSIFVIYNSFAISVSERRKQNGILASVGADRKQLRMTVLLEAIFISIIALPVGILLAFLGIEIVIIILNSLLGAVFEVPLTLAFYSYFIVIPIIFAIVTVLLSAFYPAISAGKISPIEAIRQNKDYKLKSKKIKTSKLSEKLFKAEGVYALKSLRRNSRKYIIPSISLAISIIMFVVFSCIMFFVTRTYKDSIITRNYDLAIDIYKTTGDYDITDVIEKITSNEDIVDSTTILYQKSFTIADFNEEYFTKEFLNNYPKIETSDSSALLFFIAEDDYKKYQQQLGLNEIRPILINKYKGNAYWAGITRHYDLKPYNSNIATLNVFTYRYETKTESYIDLNGEEAIRYITDKFVDKEYTIDNLYHTDIFPIGLQNGDQNPSATIYIVLPVSTAHQYGIDSNDTNGVNIYINYDNNTNLTKLLTEIEEDVKDGYSLYYNDIKFYMKAELNILKAIKTIGYTFIGLIVLIGATSILNTISTNMVLRKREFAVLRSIGLSPKGFNKVLYYETFFLGIRALLYGIPISLLICYLLNLLIDILSYYNKPYFPIGSIIISIVVVFLIILLTMLYTSRKLKKENIVDSLREENI